MVEDISMVVGMRGRSGKRAAVTNTDCTKEKNNGPA